MTAEGEGRAEPLGSAAILLLCAALLWPAVSGGAYAGWPLAATQLLILAALLAWTLGMVRAGQLEWRRTALDLPLGLFFLLVVLQLAIGNGPLRDWALAIPSTEPAPLPRRFLRLGTVSPPQTFRSLLLFASYAGVYALVVNLVRRRRDLDRLVRILLTAGGVLAFLSLVDYLSRESWLFGWRQGPAGHRLSGPFPNPDHWASWLVMLICLGLGYLAARQAPAVRVRSRVPVSSSTVREGTLRRYLPAFGVFVMALATILTLSRGALLAALGAGLLLLAGLARVRGRRWTLSLAAVLGTVTLAYALWIGLAPLLDRLGASSHLGRWEQWRSSVPMLASFPVLGVGLGAYKDIYFRFQPAALLPGRVYFPYAHSDLLQLAIETGPAGVALFLWAAGRVGRDLVGAHLLGRGRCPVTSDSQVRRNDPFSVGIMLGALGAVAALCAHSVVDFSARIPADGLLAAACLGIATVAAHTRFRVSGAESIDEARVLALGGGDFARIAVGAGAALLAAALVPPLILPARAGASAATRAELRMQDARRLWAALPGPTGPRADEARALGTAAANDLRRALVSTPSDPYIHERLAWALDLQATMDPAQGALRRQASMAHMQRAVALQPDNPFLYRSLAGLALASPAPRLAVAIEAGRAAAERDPSLLGDLVDRLAPLAPTDTQWAALVPPSTAERAALAGLLESRGLLHEARVLYERALEGASAEDEPLIRWMLARLLLGVRKAADALAQTDSALTLSPGNPELLLLRAQALQALGAPDTLDAYRAALAAAEGRKGPIFPSESVRLRTIVAERLGDAARLSPTRYRRALAQRLTEERRWDAARDEWERARTEGPLDAQGELSRGLVLEATGDRAHALEAFREAVALDPGRTAFRARLAARLWEDEEYMQAIAEWQRIVGQEPNHLEAHLALARAYVKTGDGGRALSEYRRVLALAPGQAEARQAVARLGRAP